MSPYLYVRLDLQSDCDARLAEAAAFSSGALGVEVTDARLAAMCGLGNIDPQHRAGSGGQAAIDVALAHPLPPLGATLVTIRPDADAYGAMAVLSLRAEGERLEPGMLERVAVISTEDRFDRGKWPGPRALPGSAGDIDEVGAGRFGHGALVGVLADLGLPPAEGVRIVREWITDGVLPPAAFERAAAASDRLFRALATGEVTVRLLEEGHLALVEGNVPGALRLGYRLAPVVIGIDGGMPPMRRRKATVAQWCLGHADMGRVAATLSAEEPGWGGSQTIIGSPQAAATRLAIDQIRDAVLAAWSGGMRNPAE